MEGSTMTVIAVGLFALIVVAAGALVGRLHAQVRLLRTEIAELSTAAHASEQAPVPAAPSGDALLETADAAVEDEVPVITAMAAAGDDLDLTARRVASVTLARPLIKVAALSYGLRRALDDENRFKIRYAMRQEFRRQRKMRRRRRAGRAPSMGWRS
jgi:hypothetical protein